MSLKSFSCCAIRSYLNRYNVYIILILGKVDEDDPRLRFMASMKPWCIMIIDKTYWQGFKLVNLNHGGLNEEYGGVFFFFESWVKSFFFFFFTRKKISNAYFGISIKRRHIRAKKIKSILLFNHFIIARIYNNHKLRCQNTENNIYKRRFIMTAIIIIILVSLHFLCSATHPIIEQTSREQ